MARAKYDEVSLEEAIDTFFQKDSYLPWFDHSHFDDRCLDCAGSGWEEYFDDDYFCPIYLYWEWGTLENKYRPCRTCHQTGSLLHAVNLEHSHTGVESYLGSWKQVTTST